jgi:hypothetical protein
MAISSAAAHHRARIAGIKRCIKTGERPADDPALEQAQRDLHDVMLAERVEEVIADFPKLSERQQQRVAALFTAGAAPTDGAA